jgi:hypothetical protein
MLMHGRPVLNLVYRFVPEVWGRGFVTEAVPQPDMGRLWTQPAEIRINTGSMCAAIRRLAREPISSGPRARPGVPRAT